MATMSISVRNIDCKLESFYIVMCIAGNYSCEKSLSSSALASGDYYILASRLDYVGLDWAATVPNPQWLSTIYIRNMVKVAMPSDCWALRIACQRLWTLSCACLDLDRWGGLKHDQHISPLSWSVTVSAYIWMCWHFPIRWLAGLNHFPSFPWLLIISRWNWRFQNRISKCDDGVSAQFLGLGLRVFNHIVEFGKVRKMLLCQAQIPPKQLSELGENSFSS